MKRLLPALLLLIGLLNSAALGQSISIVKKADTNYWIEATAPNGSPQTLQASANLRLWANLQDSVQGDFSLKLDSPALSPRFFRLIPTAPEPPPIRVMLLGDSMTADCCGWGGGIYSYFKPNATVVNYAAAYTSTKVFLTSAEWDKMLLLKPDYVLIQYGYVDQAWGAEVAPDRYTSLDEFRDNLRTIVNTVRSFNGVPILVTLHSARVWDANGKVIPTWGDRNAVTKEVAAELNTHLIDLNQLTMDLFNELGPKGCDFMHWAAGAPEDVMHLSPQGAQFVARLVVTALPSELGPYVTGYLEPPPLP